MTHHPARSVLTRRAEPVAAVAVAEPPPEVVEIAEDAVDDCLVLTPALRVEGADAAAEAPRRRACGRGSLWSMTAPRPSKRPRISETS